MKNLTAALILFAAVVGCESKTETPLSKLKEPPAGRAAPAFSLEDISGEKKSLNDYRGSVVIVNFWALWCAPCIAELPALEALRTKLPSEDFEVITINVDSAKKRGEVAAFLKKEDLNFTTLFDPELETADRYGVTGFPETFFIGKDGTFKKVLDPEAGVEVTKILSDRNWSSKEYVELMMKLREN